MVTLCVNRYKNCNPPDDGGGVEDAVLDSDDGGAGPQGEAEAAGVVRLEPGHLCRLLLVMLLLLLLLVMLML